MKPSLVSLFTIKKPFGILHQDLVLVFFRERAEILDPVHGTTQNAAAGWEVRAQHDAVGARSLCQKTQRVIIVNEAIVVHLAQILGRPALHGMAIGTGMIALIEPPDPEMDPAAPL